MLITLEGDDNTITYTVAPGDNLSKIAKLFGTTSRAIREINNLHVGEVIRVGQALKI
jgi:LysM repeat protein